MLISTPAFSVNLTTGAISQNYIPIKATAQVSLLGTGTKVNSNMRLALYRLSETKGTICATCNTFNESFVGSLDLNTQEMVDAYNAIESARQGELLEFILLVYDNAQSIFTIFDHINVGFESWLVPGTPPAVSPITTETLVFGSLRLYLGDLYKYNPDDGLWHKWTLAGTGIYVHEEISDVGIVLP